MKTKVSAQSSFVRNKCNAKYKWLHVLANRFYSKASVERLYLKGDLGSFGISFLA